MKNPVSKAVYLFVLFASTFIFAQQNEEFRSTKRFFDYQRDMLAKEFQKHLNAEKNPFQQALAKKDYADFMVKLDSIQNNAFINTLIKVKNREDLDAYTTLPEVQLKNLPRETLTEQAQYPGGFEKLRTQVADLFYQESVHADEKHIRAEVLFMVERDGTISNVHAEGHNFTFNRQAEIALYLLPEKFSPAKSNGNAVRYRFRLPLALTFD
ncbi:energy transducer TonB [Kaistella rhinocerotis]|uniref:energy transducer TonB n=1 Tax=Kaistella rhinocerotis TaxID=3026437 RepID=UPI0025577D38|nr:hypothetical protein [Kaistella sp. Ran72]